MLHLLTEPSRESEEMFSAKIEDSTAAECEASGCLNLGRSGGRKWVWPRWSGRKRSGQDGVGAR